MPSLSGLEAASLTHVEHAAHDPHDQKQQAESGVNLDHDKDPHAPGDDHAGDGSPGAGFSGPAIFVSNQQAVPFPIPVAVDGFQSVLILQPRDLFLEFLRPLVDGFNLLRPRRGFVVLELKLNSAMPASNEPSLVGNFQWSTTTVAGNWNKGHD